MATAAPPQPDQADGPETGGAPVVEQPTPSEPLSFGKNNRKLPDILKDKLTELVKEFQNLDLYNRNVEGLMDRTLRFYDDGIQHVYANYGTGVYQIGEAGGAINIGSEDRQISEYLGCYNISRARRRTIDAVLTQNPPGVVFEPTRPNIDQDIQASETAEGYRHLFDQMNDIPDMQQTLTRLFELSGRTVTWTKTMTNRQKWGLNDKGEPRQMETARIYGTLESKVPIICRCQDDAPFCLLYDDPHVLKAREDNPWLRNEDGTWKIKGGEGAPGENDWTRFMRLGVMQTSKGAYEVNLAVNYVVTEMNAFIRPAAFFADKFEDIYTGPSGWDEDSKQYVQEAAVDEDGQPMTVGDMFRKLFPEGLCARYIGKNYSEACPASMDDCIDIVMSEKRDSMTGGALMEPMKVIQDAFNDGKNAEREFYEKGWPVTWFRGDQQDYDAFVDQKSAPAQFALLKNPVGGPDVPVENQFYKEPEMAAPESFVEWMENNRTALSQDVTGASPALEGIPGAHDETASQRAMDKAQSMGILGPTWSRVQMVFAGIYKKAALAAAKNPDHGKSIVVATGNKQTVTIEMEKLSRGSFHCKPDRDSSFPESTAAKRSSLQAMLPTIVQSPVGQEFFASPDNWEEVLQLQGFPEMVLTPALAYRKQTREIDILLRESPEPNPAFQQYNVQHAAQTLQAMTAGMEPPQYMPPPQQLPSIAPRKRDYHKWELAKLQEFLSSEECWRQEAQGNLDGIRNVELHADAHEAILTAQMQAAAAMQQQMKPPSESIAFKDESPAGKDAMNKQAGIAAPGSEPANKQVQGNAQPPGAPGKATL